MTQPAYLPARPPFHFSCPPVKVMERMNVHILLHLLFAQGESNFVCCGKISYTRSIATAIPFNPYNYFILACRHTRTASTAAYRSHLTSPLHPTTPPPYPPPPFIPTQLYPPLPSHPIPPHPAKKKKKKKRKLLTQVKVRKKGPRTPYIQSRLQRIFQQYLMKVQDEISSSIRCDAADLYFFRCFGD